MADPPKSAVCRGKIRPIYCITCQFGSRYGCTVDNRAKPIPHHNDQSIEQNVRDDIMIVLQQAGGSLTFEDLESQIPFRIRTIRKGLAILRKEGKIIARNKLGMMDLRKKVYCINIKG
jgi:hypothetical protein